MGFVTRNLKRKGFKIGVVLLCFGISFFLFCYSNSRININDLDYSDIPTVSSSIDGIGYSTLTTVVDNKPYQYISDLKELPGVGDARYNKLHQRFSTYDVCRFEIFFIGLFLAVIITSFSCMLIYHSVLSKRVNSEDIFDAIGYHKKC